MKKTFLLLCLSLLTIVSSWAKKVYADLNQNQTIGNGTWVADSKTFSWTASNNARMVLQGLEGDLSEYAILVLETSDYTASWRVDFLCSDDAKTTITGSSSNGTAFYSAGTKSVDLQKVFADKLDLIKTVKEIRVNTNSASGSVKIDAAYLSQPMAALDFGKTGIAQLDFTDLVAKGVTFDENTGVVESTASGTGTLTVNLPADGIDMSGVNRIVVEYEGDDIANNLLITDKTYEKIGQFYSSKYNLAFNTYQGKAKNINQMVWTFNATGKMTIKAIKFYSKTFAEKYTLTVSEAGASTLVLPYTVTIPDGVKAYTVAYTSGDNVVATQLSGTIPADTPVLINAAAGDYVFVRDGESDNPNPDKEIKTKDALNGQYRSKFYAPKDSYVLQEKNGKVGFYHVAEEGKQEVPPFCAYLTAESANALAMLAIDFGDTTTDIRTVDVESRLSEGRRYNLMGEEVSNSYKGIVVVNGKKVLVK